MGWALKLADEIAAGFESLIPQVTINKDVARINYVHFLFKV